MSALRSVLSLRQLVTEDVTLKFLRADNAAMTAALLSEHLGGEMRRRPAEELYELVDADLEMLRDHLDLPHTAQYYCTSWREAGFLVRRPSVEARGETYELSPGAVAAIRIFEQIAQPRASATESRLASIAAQLGELAIETDPDTTRRLDQLEAQRDQIDARMAQIRHGEASTLDDDRALERVGEIITQAQDVPADFARVQARFEELNRSLRAAVVESEGSQRRVLDEIFRGVDLIDDSEEGRTFAAFASLVLDPVVSASFEDDIAQILARPFAARLTTAERRMLRRFLSLLKERSAEIQEVITSFARGLRRYVQSQEYQRDRVLRSAIQDALGAGVHAAAGVKPYEPTSLVLDLSAMRMTSVGEISLHDPAELDASDPIEEQELSEVDLAELKSIARLSEIDFDELRNNVNAVLANAESATVGDVLNEFPATQGIGSLIGLISLAAEQGRVEEGGEETVTWTGKDRAGEQNVARESRLAVHRFVGRIE